MRFRFCGTCGKELAGEQNPDPLLPSGVSDLRPPNARERRQITVLFCDLSGSTLLSTKLDAEDFGEVIGQYFRLCKSVFERHGGYVDREEGDCLRVYFGYPRAHDNDASRAARAALEVVAAVRKLGQELGPRIDGPFEVHVGLHSGEVVAREIMSDDGHGGPMILGEVPNIAKRLEESAQPGMVYISAAACRLIGPGFICEPLGHIQLKGISEPIDALRLTHDRGYAGAIDLFNERVLTPLLGRYREVALIEKRWSLVKAGCGQALTISGEPGIGKSRLAHTLVTELERDSHAANVLQCHEHFSNSAFFPIVDLLQRTLRFARDDSPLDKHTKLEAAFASGALPDAKAFPYVAMLLSLSTVAPVSDMTARALREQTFAWLIQWLLGGSATNPVALVVEDTHWADASTLEFLASALKQIESRHAMLLITYRSDFAPPWSTGSNSEHLSLSRLSATEAGDLIKVIAGNLDPSPALCAQIAARSDGVPLFVEELTNMLVETGALAKAGETSTSVLHALPASIPQTLRGSLIARLDHLGPSKAVAQMASVLGREFPYRLAHLVSGIDEETLSAGLARLVEAELLFQRSPPPDATYAFKHVLVQEAAYLSLLKAQRAEIHDRTACALVEHFGDLASARPEIVAFHCAAAGRAEDAIDHWHRAGVTALESSAEHEAVGHLRKALQQITTLPEGPGKVEREVKCLITLGSVLAEMRGYASPEVEETFERVHRLCKDLGDGDQLYSAVTGLHSFYQVRGHLGHAVELGHTLVRIADDAGDSLKRAQAHRCLGWSLFCRGHLREADEHLETSLGLFDRLRANEHRRIDGMHPWVAGFANSALLQWFIGRPELALERSQKAQALARELRKPLALAYALCVSAAVHACRREPEATLELVGEVAELASDGGMPYWAAWGSTLHGWALSELGQCERGLAQLETGLEQYRATGSMLFEPWGLALLAQAREKAGMTLLALSAIESALASPLLEEGYFLTAELFLMKSELLIATGGDVELASFCAAHALSLAREQGARALEVRASKGVSH
jgi:class 3 adenylate cyclase/tetratricopeptide (TPR) repeat protein